MHLVLQRAEPLADRRSFPARLTMFGHLAVDGAPECRTLEDGLLLDPLEPVADGKIPGRTAVGAGTYEIALEDSPKFGPNTPTLVGVDGFEYVRMHSGEDIDDTEGCLIVGDAVDEKNFRISGGKLRGVYARLQAKIIMAKARGKRVMIEIRDPVAA